MQKLVEDPLIEKILSDLHRAIVRYPEISGFEIIQSSEAQKNKSPVIHIDTHLGLESWCVKQMLAYTHNTLIKMRKHKTKVYETNHIERLLLGALLLNPNVRTFWNMRRELVLEEPTIQQILYDLHLTKLVLFHQPKSNEAFGHRDWLIQNLKGQLDEVQLRNLVVDELQLASNCMSHCPNNYHATHYKLQIIRLASKMLSTDFKVLIKNELASSELGMSRAVSDSSIFYYRQQIINILKDIPISLPQKYSKSAILRNSLKDNGLGAIIGKPPNTKLSGYQLNSICHHLKILIYELQFLSDLNITFPCHESIWYHRRYVLREIMFILYSLYNIDSPSSAKLVAEKIDINITNQVFSNNYFVDKMKYEVFDCILLYKIIEENEKTELEICSRDLEQVPFVERHRKWFLFSFNLPI